MAVQSVIRRLQYQIGIAEGVSARRRWQCARCSGENLQLRGKERVHGNQVTLEPGIPKYRADALEFAPCGVVSVALQAEGEHAAARRE